ncbi:hypothetical protein [Halocalculus aciditolerans]|uniref:Transcription factor zinc-finger domain-containing protein n=1 Tax=Halocalculus aciditolerans TaxID=1383812 RepID=A0A830F7G7_9EURY|nr:hypothetical protein [Halocalculus aciditolerans]GGL48269.1 hypothetical protein GCM10009039_03140 [Halocalculus aciditolerans]
MECPRCGGAVTEFTLGERSAVVCEDCGYSGVPADLHAEQLDGEESWSEAIARFYENLE